MTELDQVSAWMDIRIQLYQDFLFTGTRKYQLPTFKDYKAGLDKPELIEVKKLVGDELMKIHLGGLCVEGYAVAYRYYNIWQGTKYFTGSNPLGKWSTNQEVFQTQINENLERHNN